VTEIHDNLTPTQRMLERLEADPYFHVDNLNDLDALIPIIAWCLWVRAPDKFGKMEIIKGPHYQKSCVKIRDAIGSPSSFFFRIAGRIICATFSKDLNFNTSSEFKIDCNKGEIYVYPAFLDDVGLRL
jgi:hypothetical protein